ncbi:hypothetical protein BS50DRAFT_14390 [Corynespora cassiicola Philippines]|uniref:Uncharacterized protein n=1 Tax=Corynespora cassiicola Philippines TaxID=1448308 RepID=A0A2T2PAJ6_CORCC|nr:hypothetical protein BS50DRAFT_14390 [Corynespora cassiicola Philippines]
MGQVHVKHMFILLDPSLLLRTSGRGIAVDPPCRAWCCNYPSRMLNSLREKTEPATTKQYIFKSSTPFAHFDAAAGRNGRCIDGNFFNLFGNFSFVFHSRRYSETMKPNNQKQKLPKQQDTHKTTNFLGAPESQCCPPDALDDAGHVDIAREPMRKRERETERNREKREGEKRKRDKSNENDNTQRAIC